MRWERGQPIEWMYLNQVRPVRVLFDDDRGLAVWLASGQPLLSCIPSDGKPRRDRSVASRFTCEKHFVVQPWEGEGVVMLAPRGARHSLWLFRHRGGEFWGWYGNLERKLRRSEAGVQTEDYVLDLWLDEAGVHWKDEDEFAYAVETGRFGPELVADIRAEAAELHNAMTQRTWPFGTELPEGQPDPSWDILPLAPRWREFAGRACQDLF